MKTPLESKMAGAKTPLAESKKTPVFKALALVLVLTVFFNQIGLAQDSLSVMTRQAPQREVQVLGESQQPVSGVREDFPETSQDFLADTLFLTKTENVEDEIKPTSQTEKTDSEFNYEYERYEFEDALDLLRPEYASAVIVKSLTEQNIHELKNLSFEVGIVVLRGEIVLFSTGAEDEIGMSAPAKKLLEKADFVSHTHVIAEAQAGPSPYDLENAVAAPREEYVITEKGVYAYNQSGLLHSGEPQSYDWYLEQLRLSLRGSAADEAIPHSEIASPLTQLAMTEDSMGLAMMESSENLSMAGNVQARSELNEFITQMDLLNEIGQESETFRASGVTSFTDDFNRTTGLGANWTVIRGNYGISSNKLFGNNSYPVHDGGVVLNQALASNDYEAEIRTYFSGTMANRGLLARYQDLNNYYYAKVNRDGGLSIIKKVNGVTTNLLFKWIGGIPSSAWHTLKLAVEGSQIRFYYDGVLKAEVTDGALAVGKPGVYADVYNENFDDFSVRTIGSTPTVNPPTVNSIPAYTKDSPLVLTGTKPANTSVWINGAQAVGLDASTTWSYSMALSGDGLKSFSITTKDSAGNQSAAVSTSSITYDATLPSGSVKINNDALYTTSGNITLTLTGTDATSGVDQMRFSTDNKATWTIWQAYAATKSLSLPSVEGLKTVHYQIKDKAGNTSEYSDQITLDTSLPTGSININSGAAYATQTSVTLNLTGADSGSGIDKMSFSTDNANWTVSEAYATSKAFSLSAGEGTKTVYVKFYDRAGNASVVYSKSITLDTVAPVIVFTSASLTKEANYLLTYTLDGAAKSVQKTLATEGINLLSVTETDAAGNSTTATYAVTRDTTAPVIVFTSPVLTKDSSYLLTYTLDGVAKSAQKTLAAEGANLLSVIEADAAGNSTTAAYSVTRDTTLPSMSAVTVSNLTLDGLTISWNTDEASDTQIEYGTTTSYGSSTTLNASLVTTHSQAINTLAPSTLYHYRLKSRDAVGNLRVSPDYTFTTLAPPDTTPPAVSTASQYFNLTTETGLAGYWNFENVSGVTAADQSGNLNTGTLMNGTTVSSNHPATNYQNNGSLSFDGVNDFVATSTRFTNPNTFTISLWFNTTTTTGGKLIGFGNVQNGQSTQYDRHIYMNNAGQLIFGVYPGSVQTIKSSASYNNGQWHHVAATLSSAGMQLYVDGVLVSQKTTITTAENYPGYWKLGGDNINSWTEKPASYHFKGGLDEPRVYSRSLNASEIQKLAQGNTLAAAPPISSTSLDVVYTSDGITKTKSFFNLASGENTITITERDAAGNQTVITGKVIVQLPAPVPSKTLADGTQLIYENGLLAKEIAPGGDEIYYRADGAMMKFRDQDQEEIRYQDSRILEIFDANGILKETINAPQIPDLEETAALRMTLEGGLEAYYLNGNLVEVRTSSGIRVIQPVLDAEKNIQDALLVYPDGTKEIIRKGALLRRISPDGTISDFTPAGFSVREINGSTTQFYRFEKLSQTSVASTKIFTPDGAYSLYDEKGILREAKSAAGNRYVYGRTESSGVFVTALERGLSSAPKPESPVEMIYNASGELTGMKLENGRRVYVSGGKVTRVTDALDAEIENFSYAENQGILSGLTVTRQGNQFIYDQNGFLNKVVTASGTIERSTEGIDEETVRLLLETVGGDKLTDFELDANGNILRGVIETKEGIKQRIENGVMTGFETVDGKIYDFADSQAVLREWKFKDGTRVIYGGGTITEILYPDGKRLHTLGFSDTKEVESFTEEDADGNEKYFTNGKLVKIVTNNNTQIEYGADGMASRIVLPDASAEVVSYERDSAGAIQKIIFKGNAGSRTYSPDGTLLDLLAGGVNAEITAGEVSKMFTRYAEIQAPEINTEGMISGTLDFVDGSKQVIENGVLTQTLRADGKKVNYESGKIKSIETALAVYEIVYTETSGALTNARMRVTKNGNTREFPLVPYLVDPVRLQPDQFESDTVAHPFAMKGDAGLDTEELKFGTGSASFDGAGDYVEVLNGSSPDFNYGTEDFTIESWFRAETVDPVYDSAIWSQYAGFSNNNNLSLSIGPDRKINAFFEVNGSAWTSRLFSQSAITLGEWYHTAVVRDGNMLKLYLNGVLQMSAPVSGSAPSASSFDISVGAKKGGTVWANFFKGNIDELRVSKGIARYNAPTFQLPENHFQKDAHTKLLMHFSDPDAEFRLEEPEIASIIFPRTLKNALEDRSQVQSEFDTGDEIFFSKFVDDSERTVAYEFGSEYAPEWMSVNFEFDGTRGGYIQRNYNMDHSGDLPQEVIRLEDLDGDGLKDRVIVDTTGNFWWFQKNTGLGFAGPVRWDGVEREALHASFSKVGAMRYYEGRHAVQLAELIDMNGDSRPDRVIMKMQNGTDPEWFVQYNNGHGFDPMVLWDGIHSVSGFTGFSGYGGFAIRTRDEFRNYELVSDLIDMDGDGLPDRVVRPTIGPYDQWYFQKNLGVEGFDDARLIDGIDTTFAQDDERRGGALSWYDYSGDMAADQADLIDMDGDGLPDRVMMKNKIPGDSNSAVDWYVQINNEDGFTAPFLWDSQVRSIPGVSSSKFASSIRLMKDFSGNRNYLSDLRDVTGDGKPDRITVAQDTAGAQASWWVEVNNGSGFEAAVEWAGIYGANLLETSISQDNENFRSDPTPSYVKQVVDLQDINGDRIPDRLIFPEGSNKWLVQFGTGSGFLPAREMKIESLSASDETIRSSRYDYLHVSLKSAQALPASTGRVKVMLGEAAESESYQEWMIENITTAWQDFYLPIDPAKANASSVRVLFEPESADPGIPVYVDNVTFTQMRAPAAKDWVDRILTEENVLSEIHDERTQTLANYLGYTQEKGSDLLPVPWVERLLQAETKINFSEAGEAEQFENLYGSVSKIENGRVTETTLGGTKITFSAPNAENPNAVTQTVTKDDGSVETMDLSYGRVREISRAEGSPLQYSYEFVEPSTLSSLNDLIGDAEALDSRFRGNDIVEITVVYDPDAGITERYANDLIVSRTFATGVTNVFEYNTKSELIRTSIRYKGRERQSFGHGESMAGNKTIVTESGVVEEYGTDGKVLFHTTPEGYTFAHTFERAKKAVTITQVETVTLPDLTTVSVNVPVVTMVEDPEGEMVHHVALTGFSSAAGRAEFDSGDVLTNLYLAEGTRISFSRQEETEIFDPETGSAATLTSPLDAIVHHTNGTQTEFRGGKPYSVTTASGRVILIAPDGDGLVNDAESAQFHHAQAVKLWNEFVKPQWTAFQAPGTLPVKLDYDMDGKMLTREFAEGVIELYSEGRIEQVLSRSGERLVVYDYDEEGNPLRIEMGGARRRLNSAILKLKAEVAMEREEALQKLADREEVLNRTIEEQYADARDRLLAIRAQIEAQQNQIASIKVKGKKAKNVISDAMGQIQVGFDQVNGALAGLLSQRADALARLDQQVNDLSEKIEGETEEAYAQIETESEIAKKSILRQEISPVIYHWYRKILGRDPSTAEYDALINAIDYEVIAQEGALPVPSWLLDLKAQLTSSSELTVRATEVQSIKDAVEDQLLAFLDMSAAEKLAFAESLGIAGAELVEINSTEAGSILDWLRTRSLHFGQSAFLALEALLRDAGKSFERRELAKRLILTDILTGTISPLEEGDLVLSVYAMNRVAASYGLTTAGYKMTYAALKETYESCVVEQTADSCKLIAHINGNHYIIITKVTDTEVTYTDPGAGPEASLQEIIISKADFLQTWIDPTRPSDGFGFIISPRAPPLSDQLSAVSPQLKAESRQLTAQEQMSVRGAFFPLLIPVFVAIISAIAQAVATIVTTIITLIGAVIQGIGAVLSGFGQIFAGLFSGNFLAGLQAGFGTILNGLGQIGAAFQTAFTSLHGALLGGIQGVAGNIPFLGPVLSSLTSSSAFSGALKLGLIGFSFEGMGLMLEKIGLSPKISQSLISGGKIAIGIGLLATGNPAGIAAALGLVAGGTSEMLNLHTSLSPVVTNIIGIGAAAVGAFAGGISLPDGTTLTGLSALKAVAPHLSMDLALSGLSAVGSKIGLSPMVTSLISVPVRAAVGGLAYGALSSRTSVIDAVGNALKNSTGGLISVGASIGLEALGAPPLAKSLISDYLGQLMAGSYGGSGAGDGILSKIGEGFQKFGQGILNAGANVISFGQKIIEGVGSITTQGFKKAVNAFSSVFSRETQEGIYADETGLRQATVTADGDIWTWQSGTTRIDYNTQTGKVDESFGVGGTANITGLGLGDDGKFHHQTLSYENAVGSGATLQEHYENGHLSGWGYYYGDTAIVKAESQDGQGWQAKDGWMENGDIEIRIAPVEIEGSGLDSAPMPSIFDNFFLKLHLSGGQIAEASVEAASSSVAQEDADPRLDESLYVATNGIGYDSEDFTSNYMENLRSDLFAQSDPRIDPIKDVIVAPSFELSEFLKNALNAIFGLSQAAQIIQKIKNVWDWYQTQRQGGATDFVSDLRQSIKDLAQAQGIEPYAREMVGIGYSGGFAPIVHAMANGEFTLSSFVGLGAATAWVGSELAEFLVKVVEGFEQFITARNDVVRGVAQIATEALRFFLKGPLGVVANAADFLIDGLNTWYDVIDKQALDAKIAEFYQNLQLLIAPQFGYNWTNLANSGVELVVNVYGDKDPLTIGNLLGGHLDELGGYSTDDEEKPLFNIQIKGANHYDYIKGVYDYTDSQDITRNETVSNFVAQLILHSETANDLTVFLASKPAGITITRADPDSFNYIIDCGF